MFKSLYSEFARLTALSVSLKLIEFNSLALASIFKFDAALAAESLILLADFAAFLVEPANASIKAIAVCTASNIPKGPFNTVHIPFKAPVNPPALRADKANIEAN